MSMNHIQIARLLAEIAPRLSRVHLSRVYQNTEHLLQIQLSQAAGRDLFLTVHTEPGASGLYFADQRLGASPQVQTEFCNKLRHDLEGLRLATIEQVKNERILNVIFNGGKEAGSERRLVLELFSSAANCFLLDSEGVVLSLMHPALARKRQNFPGQPFTAPPVGRPSAALGESDPAETIPGGGVTEDYNSAVGVWLEALAAGLAFEREKQTALKSLGREIQRLEKLENTHRATIQAASRAGWHRECGDILAANFNSLRRGQEKIHLPDYYSGDRMRLREIPLDPKLSPQDNLQKYFKRARKLLGGAEFARGQLEGLRARLNSLKHLFESIKSRATTEALREDLTAAGLDRKARNKKPQAAAGKSEPRLPYREFTAEDGSAILVGRKGRDNDNLTFRVARGRDLWFHVSGSPGAHVVLRCEKTGTFGEQALLDAAHLAVFYSDLKEQPSADVDYTLCKHLTKPKGLAPGKVTLSERKTLHLRLERARLDRLLGRELFGDRE